MNTKEKINRRRFLKRSISLGVVAGGAIIVGQSEVLAQSLLQTSGVDWQITIDGQVVKEGNFSNDKTEFFIPVKNGKAHIVMDGHRIYVHEGSNICERKICAKMGAISESGESITCKPNKLVVRIF